ncbi:unnamed protein product [Arabidopsis halleri]
MLLKVSRQSKPGGRTWPTKTKILLEKLVAILCKAPCQANALQIPNEKLQLWSYNRILRDFMHDASLERR